MGVRILGGSFNEPDVIKNWVEDQSYEYEIWQDINKTLAVYYGAAQDDQAVFPGRITVILDANGNVMLEYLQPNVQTHPAKVLEDCKVLFAE